ncbi:ClC family H(+)/Cl(-) exchange transporter [Anaerosacchariphilus polymeriproducens]|uniref:ClC family H(+)/Cl(-) exchange transporter n=1 Tax=Anaerosacchariphilus polymeriproducens TaxID=1812858 RepID=A0A371ASX3_9FIRM|nr:ClC family H(+)/Cl(-) exchange transporter [Anaerosacchariphilus polymeriproducens]
MSNNYKSLVNTHTRKLYIVYKSLFIGVLAGAVSVAFRFTLEKVGIFSEIVYHFFRENLIYIPILLVILGFVGLAVGLLVQKYPLIGGSGIPQVKAHMIGAVKNKWLTSMIFKFIGGTISIIGGLSVGREGPSIQLGACVAQGVGEKIASTRTERKVLIAGGASAGLAAAFNAPLAGTMFAIEELFKYFSPIVLLAVTSAAVVADFISKTIFGIEPVFNFAVNDSIPLHGYWVFIPIGIILGLAGAFYNWSLINTQNIMKNIFKKFPYVKPVIPFLAAGVLGIYLPIVLGGGHHLIKELSIEKSFLWLIIILIIKFVFSIVSFSSGAPGGIFFPLLVLGATLGAVLGKISVTYLGFDPSLYHNFIVLAMVGMFTAIVRAPITGIILLTEMTGSFTHLLSFTTVAVIAYITADLVKSEPIYESLLESYLKKNDLKTTKRDHVRRITVESVVHFGSNCEKKLVKQIPFPDESLLISIRRDGKEIIPRGDVEMKAGDYLVVITAVKDEHKVRTFLDEMTSSTHC